MKIEKIYIDQQSVNDPITLRVIQKLKGIPIEKITAPELFLEKSKDINLTEGKKSLWITRFKGPLIKACPATDESYICCRYQIINAQMGCPLDCTYCILQNYLNRPFITIYTNTDTIPKEIDSLLDSNPERLFRIGTGELTDSLAIDHLTELHNDLIDYSGTKRNLIFELKTKTSNIKHLPKISGNNIIISWSLNPDTIIEQEEFKADSLRNRLRSALNAVKKGYSLGFHFDPILLTPGWEDDYKNLISKLTRKIPENKIMWISFGSLRFPSALKKTIDSRFPKTKITAGELLRGIDGKMRYFRPLRTNAYKKIYSLIRNSWKNVFIYFCMEYEDVWQDVFGYSPENNAHLDFMFHESISRRFPNLNLSEPDRKNYV